MKIIVLILILMEHSLIQREALMAALKVES